MSEKDITIPYADQQSYSISAFMVLLIIKTCCLHLGAF